MSDHSADPVRGRTRAASILHPAATVDRTRRSKGGASGSRATLTVSLVLAALLFSWLFVAFLGGSNGARVSEIGNGESRLIGALDEGTELDEI